MLLVRPKIAISLGRLSNPLNKWINYFQSTFSNAKPRDNPNVTILPSSHNHLMYNPLRNQLNKVLIKQISLSKIDQAFSRLKPNKAPGPNGIPNEFLKHSN